LTRYAVGGASPEGGRPGEGGEDDVPVTIDMVGESEFISKLVV